MENKAKRYNQGKVQWSLVDFKSFEDMVRVLEFGAQKYDPFNWKKGLTTRSICESTLRHLYAFLDGQDTDEESGISHIGHMQCNLMFLAYMMREKKEFDNRYKDSSQEEQLNNQ